MIAGDARATRAPFATSAILVAAAAGLGAIEGLLIAVAGPRIGLLPVAAVAGLWLVIRQPGFVLAAYLLLPFYKASLAGLSPIDLTLALGVLNAAQIPFVVGTRSFRGSRAGLGLWWALGLLVLVGGIWAHEPALATDRAISWWALIVAPLAATVRVASDPRYVRQLLAALTGIAVAIVVVGAPGVFGTERFTAIGENTLQSGAIALIGVVLAIGWLAPGGSLGIRALVAFLVPLGLVESIASGSRGPLLALGAVVVYALVRRLRVRTGASRRDVAPAMAAAAAIGIVALVADRLPGASIARLGQLDEAVGGRTNLWTVALDLFGRSPWLGQGTGGFAAYAASQPRLIDFAYPHNDLLQWAAELGVLGAGSFVAFVAVAMLRPVDPAGPWHVLRGLAWFMLTLAMVAGDIYGDRLLWGLLLLLIAAPRRETPPLPLPSSIAAPAIEAGSATPAGRTWPALASAPSTETQSSR